MLNIISIHAIRKTRSLPKTLKILLLSLAVSDVSVGLLGQPFYISLMVEWLQHNSPGCNPNMVFTFIVNAFSLASFFIVVTISVERFLAIHFHLRYQELVTHTRVVVVLVSIWVLSGLLPAAVFWIPLDFYMRIKFILGVIGVLLTTVAYIRLYLAVRHHKNQMQALQVQQVAENGEMANFISLVKSAVGIFYVYLVFLICYLPFFISLVALNINGTSINLKKFFLYSVTVMFLNSSLNPVIYCWKMRHIRRAVINILRNMSWFRNRGSHLF
ncbi:melanocyte-stimulating hormone receptor-like [Montipora capricornis]|uniref:melanocyte-stimulating hormone receptor-like n=1 Tax=Montipora capricornis TaxID=246305 RepID=UPI0035F14BDF